MLGGGQAGRRNRSALSQSALGDKCVFDSWCFSVRRSQGSVLKAEPDAACELSFRAENK